MMTQINRADDKAPPVTLFDIVKSTTACSSTVFYGLLAWADLRAHNSSKAEPMKSAKQAGARCT